MKWLLISLLVLVGCSREGLVIVKTEVDSVHEVIAPEKVDTVYVAPKVDTVVTVVDTSSSGKVATSVTYSTHWDSDTVGITIDTVVVDVVRDKIVTVTKIEPKPCNWKLYILIGFSMALLAMLIIRRIL